MKIYVSLLIAIGVLLGSCTKKTVACFTSSSETALVDSSVSFDAGCSQSASFFTWNFGDGSADTTLSSPIIKHIYSAAGTYSVELNVTRKDGNTLGRDKYTFTRSIQVN